MTRAITRQPGSMIVTEPALAVGSRAAHPGAHPWAWWGWALCCATVITLVRNPLLIVLLVAAVVTVVICRRSDAPWARSVSAYFALALVIIGVRVVLQSLFGVQRQGLVLFTLPQVDLPEWAAGITVGGPVTLSGVVAAVYEGLRLGAVIVCVGAANSLANPRRALKSVPAALREVSVAIAISLTLAPQLVESMRRVRASRRLRGSSTRGIRATARLVIPVLDDAIDRSLHLAAGMAARGYGRTLDRSRVGWLGTGLLILGMMVMVVGVFTLPTLPDREAVAFALLGVGLVIIIVGLRIAGRRLAITRHRPQPWRWSDSLLLGQGVLVLAIIAITVNTAPQLLSASPTRWPQLHPIFLLVAGLTLVVPLVVTSTETTDGRPQVRQLKEAG